jgi:hypothetical protein
MSLRKAAPLTAAALMAAALSGCGVTELDTSQPGYVQAGEEFWDGWQVPEGSVLLGTPFPEEFRPQQEGLPEDPESVTAEFLLTEDPYTAVRDLAGQFDAKGLRAVADPDLDQCGVDPVFACSLYGVGEDGLTKLAAHFTDSENRGDEASFPRLHVEIGAWTSLYPQRDDWIDFQAPQGESGLELPDIDAGDLEPGTEVPLLGTDEELGEVPEGTRLLAPLYNPSATYGVHAVFHVEDEAALADIEAMAEKAATGERYPDGEITSGGLASHRIAYDGSAGGCQVKLDTVATGDAVIALLDVACD